MKVNDYPKYMELPFEQLYLDENNPRLPQSYHGANEQDIIGYLLTEAATIELMIAIGQNDFFRGEQLLVVEFEENKYKVIEGNRRLTAVKLLNDYQLANIKESLVKKVYDEKKYTPKNIPCLIFKEADEIRKYLGFRHITGIKSWALSEKARFLSQLKEKQFDNTPFHEACRGLAKMIGSRKDYVERLIVAYEMYKEIEEEGFYRIKDLDDTSFFVGYLSDSLSRTHITNFLNIKLNSENPTEDLNKKNLKDLIHWFYEKNDQNQTRLKGKSSDLNALNRVLSNEYAFKSFKEGTPLYEALELTEETDELYRDSIKKSLKHLEMADRTVHKVSDFYIDAEDDLSTIRKLAVKIKNTMEDLEDEI